MFITSYIWPISARFEVRVGLSELYLHLAWFFRTKPSPAPLTNGVSESNALERAEDGSPLDQFRPMLNRNHELALQGLLGTLSGLLNAAALELRLKVDSLGAAKLMVGSISCGRVSENVVDSTRYSGYTVPFQGDFEGRNPVSK